MTPGLTQPGGSFGPFNPKAVLPPPLFCTGSGGVPEAEPPAEATAGLPEPARPGQRALPCGDQARRRWVRPATCRTAPALQCGTEGRTSRWRRPRGTVAGRPVTSAGVSCRGQGFLRHPRTRTASHSLGPPTPCPQMVPVNTKQPSADIRPSSPAARPSVQLRGGGELSFPARQRGGCEETNLGRRRRCRLRGRRAGLCLSGWLPPRLELALRLRGLSAKSLLSARRGLVLFPRVLATPCAGTRADELTARIVTRHLGGGGRPHLVRSSDGGPCGALCVEGWLGLRVRRGLCRSKSSPRGGGNTVPVESWRSRGQAAGHLARTHRWVLLGQRLLPREPTEGRCGSDGGRAPPPGPGTPCDHAGSEDLGVRLSHGPLLCDKGGWHHLLAGVGNTDSVPASYGTLPAGDGNCCAWFPSSHSGSLLLSLPLVPGVTQRHLAPQLPLEKPGSLWAYRARDELQPSHTRVRQGPHA